MLQTIPTFSYSRENPPAKMIDFRQSVIEQATELASIPEVTDLQPDSDLEMNMLLPRIVWSRLELTFLSCTSSYAH